MATRPLLHNLLALLADARPAFGQARVFAHAEALVIGQLLTLGRHTITQSLWIPWAWSTTTGAASTVC